jgi:hypothetical protein
VLSTDVIKRHSEQIVSCAAVTFVNTGRLPITKIDSLAIHQQQIFERLLHLGPQLEHARRQFNKLTALSHYAPKVRFRVFGSRYVTLIPHPPHNLLDRNRGCADHTDSSCMDDRGCLLGQRRYGEPLATCDEG